MILEVAILDIKSGLTKEFEAAFAEASNIISEMRGYAGHELRRCVGKPNRYILLVQWQQLEDHTDGFRGYPRYQEWKALLHRFYSPFPAVEHYEPVFTSEGAIERQ